MKAVFKCSSERVDQLPRGGLVEIAFIGRSNVGKSSLINMLTGQNGLAKVSATPGKTRLINHFLIDNSWYLVDLPGYGYAKVAKTEKKKFAKIITDYIFDAPQLHYLFVLIDSRLEPQKIDLEFIDMLGAHGVPFGIIFTKADKQTARQTAINVENFGRKLKERWDELPPMLVTSSTKKQGGKEVIDFIEKVISL